MISFPPWAPDQPPIGSQTLSDALNVFPGPGGVYQPIPDLAPVGNALTARCQGAFAARGIAGTNVTVAGDATKLYTFDGSAWSDASGSTYATATTDMWAFTRANDQLIAVNGANNPQVYVIESGGNFADLGGSPPVARYATQVGPHTFLGKIVSHFNRVKWSAESDPTGWTPGVNLSDEQDLPTGGQVMGITGGEYLIALMETSIYRGNYVGADPVFTFDRIAKNFGCSIDGSVANFNQTTFFANWDGFYQIDGGQQFTLIGREKVDHTFWNTINQSYLYRVTSTVDPVRRLYCISFPSKESTNGTPDTIYFYSIDQQRWTRAQFNIETLFPYRSGVGYNTDTIDAVIGNTDATNLSMDTPLFLGSASQALGAFNTSHKVASFGGMNVQGTISTSEMELSPGFLSKITAVRPITDCSTAQVKVYGRKTAQAAQTSQGPVTVNSRGDMPFRKIGRYHSGDFIFPANATWTNAQGFNVSFVQEGKR